MIQLHAKVIIYHDEKNFIVACCKLVDLCQPTNTSMRTKMEELVTGCMNIPILEVNDY